MRGHDLKVAARPKARFTAANRVYPWSMTEGSREPSRVPSAKRLSEPEVHADRESEGEERFGPLAVERHRKADGRQLILYSWAEDG